MLCGIVEGFYGRPWTPEQRRHLFKSLKKFGMNTYLYAPKDDVKHREKWRESYNDEEKDALSILINTSKECDITFVYALSPGIDIQYSSKSDLDAILNKFKQVQSLGCNAFALLFDDIMQMMLYQDAQEFRSFAAAQCYVSNKIFGLLGSPTFMFCPTEYCEDRTKPSLKDSEYLNTVGTELHSEIMVMWTGPFVVSKLLTPEHAREVAAVLRRKPLIWDNLHANDYDPKRIFAGPYKGREVELKNEISGMLLNPNTKYEANYIPLYTFGDWYRAGSSSSVVDGGGLDASTRGGYNPEESLQNALGEWVHCFTRGCGPAVPPISQMETRTITSIVTAGTSSVPVPPPNIRTCEANKCLIPDAGASCAVYSSAIGTATTVTVQSQASSDAVIPIAMPEEIPLELPQGVNSLLPSYSATPPSTAAIVLSSQFSDYSDVSSGCDVHMSSDESSSDDGSDFVVTPFEALKTFVDIFYLPFEHGSRGVQLLREFNWLAENAKVEEEQRVERNDQWVARYNDFRHLAAHIDGLYRVILTSPNKSILQEIFPYVWDTQGVLSMLCAVLTWCRRGNLQIKLKEGSTGWWEDESMEDKEPWALGGGFLCDLQNVVVRRSQLQDFFVVKYNIPLTLTFYKIRPLSSDDNQFDKKMFRKRTSVFKAKYSNEFRGIKRSKKGEEYATCTDCIADISQASMGKAAIAQHQAKPKHVAAIKAKSSTQSLSRSCEKRLYERFSTQVEREMICELIGENNRPEEFFFDRFFREYLICQPPHHFGAYEPDQNSFTRSASNFGDVLSLGNDGINNYVVIGLGMHYRDTKFIRDHFLPSLEKKYKAIVTEDSSIDDQLREQRHAKLEKEFRKWPALHISNNILRKYNSRIEIHYQDAVKDAVAVRRIVRTVATTLSLNGSTGFFTIVNASEVKKIELLGRIGLQDILVDPELYCDCQISTCMCNLVRNGKLEYSPSYWMAMRRAELAGDEAACARLRYGRPGMRSNTFSEEQHTSEHEPPIPLPDENDPVQATKDYTCSCCDADPFSKIGFVFMGHAL